MFLAKSFAIDVKNISSRSVIIASKRNKFKHVLLDIELNRRDRLNFFVKPISGTNCFVHLDKDFCRLPEECMN